jgi:hypothetical protein
MADAETVAETTVINGRAYAVERAEGMYQPGSPTDQYDGHRYYLIDLTGRRAAVACRRVRDGQYVIAYRL